MRRRWINQSQRFVCQERAYPLALGPRAKVLPLGAAIVGDPVYSLPDDAELGAMTLPDSGMLLHAWRLVVPRQPKDTIDVTAPVPDRFGLWLDHL